MLCVHAFVITNFMVRGVKYDSVPYMMMIILTHIPIECWVVDPNLYGHSNETGNSTNHDNFTIIGREDHGLARTITESIYIRINNPTLNGNVGKYNLHHIWDRVLFNTPDLKVSNDNRHAHRTSFSGHAQSIPTSRLAHRTIEHIGHAQTSEHVHRTSKTYK